MLVRWLQIAFGLTLLIGLAGCSQSPVPPPFKSSAHAPSLTFLDPQGPVAAAQRAHLIEVVLILLIVVLPVLVFTPIVAWRYRYSGSARYAPNWTFYWPLEFVVWGIPIAIVAVLGIWLWRSTKALDPYAPLSFTRPPLRVEVIGYDWKWLFIYPDLKIASIGEFAFPADRPLAVDLTSDTVMQSFFIPALGSQIYAMPAMVTKLHLIADGPGSFRGENTQFNGEGFYEQNFTAEAMTSANFTAWVNRVQTKGVLLSDEVYGAIRQRSTLADTRKALGAGQGQNGVLYFTAVSPNLFERVVDSFMMPPPATSSDRGSGAPANAGSGATRSAHAIERR